MANFSHIILNSNPAISKRVPRSATEIAFFGLEIPQGRRIRRAGVESGFSLVEVSLALGIVAFGITAVFGLLPTGLGLFRDSMDTTIGSQILQQVVSEVQETGFDQLIEDQSNTPIAVGSTGIKAIRYFDDQGRELSSEAGAVFLVNTRIQPATDCPSSPSNPNLATVTIQVARRPVNRELAYESDPDLGNLWSGAYAGSAARVVNITTASTMVSR